MGLGSKANFVGSAWPGALYSTPPVAAKVTKARECQRNDEIHELLNAAVLSLQGGSPALVVVS